MQKKQSKFLKSKILVLLLLLLTCTLGIFTACASSTQRPTTQKSIILYMDDHRWEYQILKFSTIEELEVEFAALPEPVYDRTGYAFDGWYFDEKTFQKPVTVDSLLENWKKEDRLVAFPKFIGKDIFKFENGTILGLTDYGWTLTELVIPEEIDGIPVTSIGREAFWRRNSIQKVTLPKTLVSIGDSAFSHCYHLKEIEFPDSLTTIGSNAFNSCTFKQITIPKNLKELGSSAFTNCSELETIYYTAIHLNDSNSWNGYPNWFSRAGIATKGITVIVDKSVEYIPKKLFYTLQRLGENDLPLFEDESPFVTTVQFNADTQLKEIGQMAFGGLLHLKEIVLPDTITVIGVNAFWNCRALTEITIPENVVQIGNAAFALCKNIEKIYFNAINCQDAAEAFVSACAYATVYIGNKVTQIPSVAFGAITGIRPVIQSVIFQENSVCEKIGHNAFASVEWLDSMNLPKSVKRIERSAFYGCTGLRFIDLSYVESVGDYAFQSSGLHKVIVSERTKEIGEGVFHTFSSSRVEIFSSTTNALSTWKAGWNRWGNTAEEVCPTYYNGQWEINTTDGLPYAKVSFSSKKDLFI